MIVSGILYVWPGLLTLTDAVCSFVFHRQPCWKTYPCLYSRRTILRFTRLKLWEWFSEREESFSPESWAKPYWKDVLESTSQRRLTLTLSMQDLGQILMEINAMMLYPCHNKCTMLSRLNAIQQNIRVHLFSTPTCPKDFQWVEDSVVSVCLSVDI